MIIRDDDPLGLRKVVLGGAPPSLEVEAEIALRQWKIESGQILMENITKAFLVQDEKQARDEVCRALNRAVRMISEGRNLTELWKNLARVLYQVQEMDLSPEMCEMRGYLEAIVHLARAVRERTGGAKAAKVAGEVKSCERKLEILNILKQEGTVSHCDLANRLNISPDTLTQTVRQLLGGGVVTSTVHGKSKYYSLTLFGRIVAGNLF